MQRLEIKTGDKHGVFTFVEYVNAAVTAENVTGSIDVNGRVHGKWQCGHCGSVVIRANCRILSGKIKSCGCKATFNMKKKQNQTDPDYGWSVVFSRVQLRCQRTKKSA